MKSQNLHSIIIGGGIAGPALALLLKKAGITSTVYEAHPRLEDVGGGFTIAPNGMNVLEEVGVADSIASSGALVSEFCFRDHRGKVLARKESRLDVQLQDCLGRLKRNNPHHAGG